MNDEAIDALLVDVLRLEELLVRYERMVAAVDLWIWEQELL